MLWFGGDTNGWGYALMAISMLVFWGLVIAGVVLLVRYLGSSGQIDVGSLTPRTPEQLLAERFAHGEIDEHEYSSRLATLSELVRS